MPNSPLLFFVSETINSRQEFQKFVDASPEAGEVYARLVAIQAKGRGAIPGTHSFAPPDLFAVQIGGWMTFYRCYDSLSDQFRILVLLVDKSPSESATSLEREARRRFKISETLDD